jgi:hypothetical protein
MTGFPAAAAIAGEYQRAGGAAPDVWLQLVPSKTQVSARGLPPAAPPNIATCDGGGPPELLLDEALPLDVLPLEPLVPELPEPLLTPLVPLLPAPALPALLLLLLAPASPGPKSPPEDDEPPHAAATARAAQHVRAPVRMATRGLYGGAVCFFPDTVLRAIDHGDRAHGSP